MIKNLRIKKMPASFAFIWLLLINSISFHVHSAQTADAYTTGYRYNMIGQLTGTISPDPGTQDTLAYPASRNTYNNLGLLIKVESGKLANWQNEVVAPASWSGFSIIQTQHLQYNDLGWKTESLSQSLNGTNISLTHYSYNDYGQLWCVAVRMNPNGGAKDACTLSRGASEPDRITRYDYNNFGQVLTEERAVGTALQQVYVTNTYDDQGRKTDVYDANNNRTNMRYDQYNRVDRVSYPTKSSIGSGQYDYSDYEEYSFNANGNRLSLRKRDGKTIYYIYDALNQVTKKNWPNTTAKDVYYEYDLRGLELHARYGSDAGLGVTRVFDGFGRLSRESNNSSGINFNINHKYDANSNRTEITHPDGKTFQYAYDGLDRRTTIKENGGAIIHTQIFDAYARPKAIETLSSSTNIGYSSSKLGLHSLNHNFTTSAKNITFAYKYNAASQLSSLTISNSLYKYNLDGVGSTGSYEVNGLNQYTKVNGKSLSYDDNGNLTHDGSKGYSFDVENRLTSTSNYVTLKYDPLGRLNTLKHYTNETRSFLYDGDALIAEYKGTQMVNRYVHGGGIDNPVFMYNGSGVSSTNRYGLHSNHQGSIIATSLGTSVDINSYDSYGVPSDSNQGRFGYTGQLYLSEIGLNYYKARIYHPKLGRFLQTDPIGYEDQMNLYSYVGNDPVNRIDPSGMISYLVSRPLGSDASEGSWKPAHHNFIVTNANFVGDTSSGVQVISYGKLDNGNMGRVAGEVNATDSAHWASLNKESTTASYRLINAKDSKVLSYANSLNENLKYNLLPNNTKNGANSNSGAGAVANNSDGGSTRVSNIAVQPGHSASDRVSFSKSNSDSGMSSGKTIICSGMGAQKGGC